jgi:HK97 family phage major capsid protein
MKLSRNELATLREQRAEAHTAMRALLDANPDELSRAQAAEYDRHEATYDELDGKIKAAEATNERMLRESVGATGGATGVEHGPFLGQRRMVDWASERELPQRDRERGYDEDVQRDFSIGRLVRGMVTGRWDSPDAPERRALDSGASATGGVLVPTLTSAGVIDLLRNQAQVLTAGASIVPMGSEKVTLPRITADPSGVPAWRGQNDAVASGAPAFDGVSLVSKTLAGLYTIPYELLEDISPEAADAITNTIVSGLALEVDRASLYGSGAGDEPHGLKGTAGVSATAIATNGAVPTNYSALTKAVFACRKRNVHPNAAIYSERTAETFAGLTDSTGQPLRPPAAVESLTQLSTNQVPDNLTQGTATGVCSDLFVGDWSNLAIGFRPEVGFRLVSDRAVNMDHMQVTVLAYVRADVAVLRPAAFEITTGIKAS